MVGTFKLGLVVTCQVNGSSPFNVPDMFPPVSRGPRPQCQSMSLHLVSPSEGESEVEAASISTHETTPGPNENVVPLPVVRGVIQSTSRVRPGPYSIPAAAHQLHIDPSIVHHYLTTIVQEWPNRGIVQIRNTSYGSVLG